LANFSVLGMLSHPLQSHPVRLCLSELSKNNNQLSTSYALLRHDCYNALTNIDLVVFIPIREHTCIYNCSSSYYRLTALRGY